MEGPWSLLASVFIPMMRVRMTIPESFAGERERHCGQQEQLSSLAAIRILELAQPFGA